METQKQKMYLTALKESIALAKGCTEPVSVALAAATCGEQLKHEPVKAMAVNVSPNVMKNAMAVIVPGTGKSGLMVAAVVGYLFGKADRGLSVIPTLTRREKQQITALIGSGKVQVALAKVPDKLYANVKVTTNSGHNAETYIAGAHTNVYLVKHDGDTVLDHGHPHVQGCSEWQRLLAENGCLADIWNFAGTAPLADLQFMEITRKYNMALVKEGLTHDYGMNVGRAMSNPHGLTYTDSLSNRIVADTAAAADARMGGTQLLAATNSGSGNQGITATVPVCVFAEDKQATPEQLIRALSLSHLTLVYIHAFLPSLSAYCAVHAAGMGAAAGICYLAGRSVDDAGRAIKTMIGDANGMICDGAGCSCAVKVATSVETMLRAVNLAFQGITIPGTNGVISDSVDETIRGLGKLVSDGMTAADPVILQIMQNKNN